MVYNKVGGMGSFSGYDKIYIKEIYEMATSFVFDWYSDSVTNISRKYARKVPGLDQEDLEQEIWVHLCQYSDEQLSDIKWAHTFIFNKAIDICRKHGKDNFRYMSTEFDTLSGDGEEREGYEGEMVVFDHAEDDTLYDSKQYDSVESEENIRSAINVLPEREKKFAICKAYLSCNMEFLYNDFMDVIKDLSQDAKDKLLDSDNGDTDDTILKVVLGIKTGTNSGSIRKMKSIMRDKFREILVSGI